MLEEVTEKIYIPWEDDEIRFLDGDWQIWRDDCFGMYRYIISGVEGQESVDAVQLIAWNMAEILCYDSMTPWGRSDITFITKDTIIRNPIDMSHPQGMRTYIIAKDDSFLEVNKYYLILNKYAKAGKKTIGVINDVCVNVCDIYPDDDIVLIPYSNVSISKAWTKGLYQIKINSMTLVRDAKYLLDNDYAKPAYQARLEELSKQSSITIDDLRKKTCDFWLSADAYEISSLRQIARTYAKIESGGDSELLRRIDELTKPLHDVEETLDNIEKSIVSYREQSNKLSNLSIESHDLIKAMPDERFIDVLSNIDKDKSENAYTRISLNLEEANRLLAICKGDLELIAKINAIRVPDISINSKVFPKGVTVKIDGISKLTKKIKQRVSIDKAELKLFNGDYLPVVDKNFLLDNGKSLDVTDIKTLEKILAALETCAKIAKNKLDTVRAVIERRDKLDKIKKILGNDAYKSKKYFINRTYKYDRIKYTTAIKIVHVGSGKYTIPKNPIAKNLLFSAVDLIYLGLAKRY